MICRGVSNWRQFVLGAAAALALLLAVSALATASARAEGSRSVTSAGAYTVTLKLTRAGKRLLRGGRRVKGKLSLGKASGGSLTGATGVTLKRR